MDPIKIKKITSKYIKNLKLKYGIKAEAHRDVDNMRINFKTDFDIESLNKEFLKDVWITFNSLTSNKTTFLILISLRFGDTIITLDKVRKKIEFNEMIFSNIILNFLLGPQSDFYKSNIETLNDSTIIIQSWRI